MPDNAIPRVPNSELRIPHSELLCRFPRAHGGPCAGAITGQTQPFTGMQFTNI